MWEWWDNTVDSATEAIDDAWSSVTDWSGDAYDTASAWVSEAAQTVYDTVDPYFTATWDALGDAGDYIADWAGDAYNAATNAWAGVEDWVRDTFDIPDQEGKGFVGEATEKITETATTFIDNTRTTVGGAITTVNTYYNTAREALGDIINNIEIVLGVGLEAAFAALGSLPDLLKEFRDNLAKWFEFDLEKFLIMWQEAQAKMKEEKE